MSLREKVLKTAFKAAVWGAFGFGLVSVVEKPADYQKKYPSVSMTDAVKMKHSDARQAGALLAIWEVSDALLLAGALRKRAITPT